MLPSRNYVLGMFVLIIRYTHKSTAVCLNYSQNKMFLQVPIARANDLILHCLELACSRYKHGYGEGGSPRL